MFEMRLGGKSGADQEFFAGDDLVEAFSKIEQALGINCPIGIGAFQVKDVYGHGAFSRDSGEGYIEAKF